MNLKNLPLNEPRIDQKLDHFERLVDRHDKSLSWAKELQDKAQFVVGEARLTVLKQAALHTQRASDVLLQMEREGFFLMIEGQDPNPVISRSTKENKS
jgi:alkaline phosphatase